MPSTLGTLGGAAGHALQGSSLLRGRGKGTSVSNLTLAPRTIFNHSVTTGRAFATLSLPLAELKAIGHAHDAGVEALLDRLDDAILVAAFSHGNRRLEFMRLQRPGRARTCC